MSLKWRIGLEDLMIRCSLNSLKWVLGFHGALEGVTRMHLSIKIAIIDVSRALIQYQPCSASILLPLVEVHACKHLRAHVHM